MTKKFHFRIQFEFDLDAMENQKDEMRKIQHTLEDIILGVFENKVHNLSSQLKEAKPID
jgi:hypothetical protein